MKHSRSVAGTRRLLAVASGGGHWTQLMRLRPAFSGFEVTYVTVDQNLREEVHGERFATVRDGNRDTKLALLAQFIRMLLLVLRLRPHAVVTTGAAPGLMAVVAGRLVGARTLFIDSIANAEELSLSAKLSLSVATESVTQWEGVSRRTRARFGGSVL